jgi:hypothetical protein
MLHWLLNPFFRRGFASRRGRHYLRELDHLARSGAASWLLAQERARLEYLAAKEAYGTRRTWANLQCMLDRLLKLSSTNALVQSLLNEQAIERRIAEAQAASPGEQAAARRCA